jgi:hypothetical protein
MSVWLPGGRTPIAKGACVSSERLNRPAGNDSDVQPCPACQAPRGVPFSVESALPGKIIVTYRCNGCRHEWQVSRVLNS